MRFHRKYFNQNKAVALRATASFLALGLIFITAQCSSLSPKDRSLREVAVGRALTARFAKADGIVKNATATSYVSLVGQAVVEAAGQSDKDYHFAILDTDESISVAGPGGDILISKGYIKSLSSEAELAAVLAMEVAHVALAHHDDSLLTDGSLIETSESGSEELYETIRQGKRSAEQVYEADAAAAFYLASLGYDPAVLVRVVKLGTPQKHASTADRQSKVKSVIEQNGLSGQQTNTARFQASTRGL